MKSKFVKLGMRLTLVALMVLVASAGVAQEPQAEEPSSIACGDAAYCSTAGNAVYVRNTGTGPSIFGENTSTGDGLKGRGNPGVYGFSYHAAGVRGKSNQGVGVKGESLDKYGVEGTSGYSTGVKGQSYSGTGVSASSEFGNAVSAFAARGDGVHVSWAGASGLYVGYTEGQGLHVENVLGNGVWVNYSMLNGFAVDRAHMDGAHIETADEDGVHVVDAGNYGLLVDTAGNDGLYVGSAGADGVQVASAQAHGVYVLTAGNDGVNVWTANDDGFYVENAVDDGFVVQNAGDIGVVVQNATGYGIYVANNGTEGVVVENSGWDGVYVSSAVNRGVYAHTTNANQEWGLYTPDKLYAGAGLGTGGPLMLVAQNGDEGTLEPGDVVVAAGLGQPFAGSPSAITLVRRPGAAGSQAVAGVVYRRFVAEEKTKEHEQDGEVRSYTEVDTHTTDGGIAPGEYLLMVVAGTCQIKVDATAAPVHPGDVLAVSSTPGHAAPAPLLTVEGISFYPPGVTFGTALEPLEGGTGLVHVFIAPR